jgi:ornithine cyclodeaminase
VEKPRTRPLLLTREDLRPVFTDPRELDGFTEALEAAYCEPSDGESGYQSALWVPRGADGQTMLVSASALADYGVALWAQPRGPRREVLAEPRLMLLFDPRDGELLALFAADDFQAVRIAVPTAVACRHLAPREPRVLAVVGSGVQGRAHLPVLRHTFPSVEEIRVFSPTPEHRTTLAREMGARLGTDVRAVDEARAAVEGADVVAAVSNATQPAFEGAWVKPGALVASIARGQLPGDLVAGARIIVNRRAQFVVGGGRRGERGPTLPSIWDTVQPAGDLREVIQGAVPAREREDEVVLFLHMGLASGDAALLAHAYRWARERGLGTELSL